MTNIHPIIQKYLAAVREIENQHFNQYGQIGGPAVKTKCDIAFYSLVEEIMAGIVDEAVRVALEKLKEENTEIFKK